MSKGSSGVIGYDDFLTHESGKGGGSFLKSWKDDGQIDVWTHPKAMPGVRWAHSFWHIVEKKGKGGDPESLVRSYRWICHERPAILGRQRFRDDDIGEKPHGLVGNGRREYPPEVCPMCLLIELLRDQVRAGRLNWTLPLFEWKFAGDDSEVVTVGGFCGLFSRAKNDYSDEQKEQMRRAGVAQDEIFMENGAARCDYLLRVVDDANPDDGCVIANVADSLGRKVQKAFKDRIEMSKGAWHPSKETMCLRWKFDDSQAFEKKYDVVPLIEAKPSEDVLAAIAEEPPSIDDMLEPGNVATLRAQMEKHCVLKGLPWDSVFGPSERAAAERGADAPGDEPWDQDRKAPDQSKTQAQVPATAPVAPKHEPKPQAQPAPAPAPAAPAGVDEYDCEVCQAVMQVPKGAQPPTTCSSCGSEYDSFTGALTFDATKPVGAGNMPRNPPKEPEKAAESPPPAGKAPARRRRAG